MAEYISREAVEQVLRGIANGLSVGATEALKTKGVKALYKIQGAKEILNAVDNVLSFIPVADVQPVVHGYWEDCEIRGSFAMCCSVCGCDSGVLYNYAYCPNCGARMIKDGEAE